MKTPLAFFIFCIYHLGKIIKVNDTKEEYARGQVTWKGDKMMEYSPVAQSVKLNWGGPVSMPGCCLNAKRSLLNQYPA